MLEGSLLNRLLGLLMMMILQHGLVTLGGCVLSLSFLLCSDVVLGYVPLLSRLLTRGTK